MEHPATIAMAQISGEPYELEANRQLCVDTIGRAFEGGANLVVLPELIVQGYVADAARLFPIAESISGPTVGEWTKLAREAEGYIVGGFAERDGQSLYNTAVAVGPEGVIGHYRKTHLFADEKVAFVPGDLGFPVFRTRFGTVGICVCYDLRFVEVVRIMALKGADIICVPTAWMPGYDQQRWDADGMSPQGRGAELQANLNQVFIACASQAGEHGQCDFLGSSILVDPYGKRLMGPLSGSDDELILVDIDVADAKRAQTRGEMISPRADRRTDIYGIRIGDEVL